MVSQANLSSSPHALFPHSDVVAEESAKSKEIAGKDEAAKDADSKHVDQLQPYPYFAVRVERGITNEEVINALKSFRKEQDPFDLNYSTYDRVAIIALYASSIAIAILFVNTSCIVPTLLMIVGSIYLPHRLPQIPYEVSLAINMLGTLILFVHNPFFLISLMGIIVCHDMLTSPQRIYFFQKIRPLNNLMDHLQSLKKEELVSSQNLIKILELGLNFRNFVPHRDEPIQARYFEDDRILQLRKDRERLCKKSWKVTQGYLLSYLKISFNEAFFHANLSQARELTEYGIRHLAPADILVMKKIFEACAVAGSGVQAVLLDIYFGGPSIKRPVKDLTESEFSDYFLKRVSAQKSHFHNTARQLATDHHHAPFRACVWMSRCMVLEAERTNEEEITLKIQERDSGQEKTIRVSKTLLRRCSAMLDTALINDSTETDLTLNVSDLQAFVLLLSYLKDPSQIPCLDISDFSRILGASFESFETLGHHLADMFSTRKLLEIYQKMQNDFQKRAFEAYLNSRKD